MASDYGLNFGFRRSDESMAVREGRFKTPASGTALLIGTAVQIDPAVPGYLKQCAANAAPVSGLHGLLIQEESHLLNPLLDITSGHDSYDLGTAKLDQLSAFWSGPGIKVWFKNTGVYARGGRSKAAITMFTAAGVAVGDRLGWNGTRWVESDGTTIPHWMSVTNVATNYCEAVLTF